MKHFLDPGRSRQSVFFFDHIVYSHTADQNGNPIDLEISVTSQLTGPQLQIALGRKQPEERPNAGGTGAEGSDCLRPAMIWFNGNGWRGIDKNAQLGDLVFLAEHGYAVICADYRNSAQAHFPAQIIDAKTAVRYVRAHAARYSIDPNRIGVMGRSAGGQISSMLGLNDDRFLSEEWSEVSSNVQAVWEMFGPTDMYEAMNSTIQAYRNGTASLARWQRAEDTHEGAYLGGDEETMLNRAAEATPLRYLHDGMPPFLIMHGDADPAVPYWHSEKLHDGILAAGEHNVAEFWLIHNAGHGTPEFFHPEAQRVAIDFLDQYLKR